jgi:histidinol-phosphatase (PHP family)
MRQIIDMHVHSTCSTDGKASLRDMCLFAIKNGLQGICLTEHCDFNPLDTGYLLYNNDRCTSEIEAARREIGTRLEILQGIEFSEPHRYPKEFEAVTKGLDFVLASIHWVGNCLVGDPKFVDRHKPEDVFELYYKEVMETIRLGGFDSLAHLDQPKKYVAKTREPAEIMASICSELTRRGICMELNSSILRKGMDEIYPGDWILDCYVKEGGTFVTLGSDAHDSCEIASGFSVLEGKMQQYGLTAVVYRQRKRFIIEAG